MGSRAFGQFTIDDLTDDATEPVLRLVVFPDTPNTVTAQGMQGTSSVQHVVLRDEPKRIVIQPTFKEPFSEETSNAMGGKATFQGLQVKFPLDALREIRGSRGDREFFITVIGSSGEEKDFKVKRSILTICPDREVRSASDFATSPGSGGDLYWDPTAKPVKSPWGRHFSYQRRLLPNW